MAENEAAEEKREETQEQEEVQEQIQIDTKTEDLSSEEKSPDTEAEKKPADETEQNLSEEEVYVFGDQEETEEKPDQDSSIIRKMRDTIRKQKQKIKQFETQQTKEQESADPGPKPTLQGCEMDDELFSRRLLSWKDKKDAYEQKQEATKKQEETNMQAWQEKVGSYTESRKTFSKTDFEEKESIVIDALGDRRAAGIVDICDNAVKMMYALGSNPEKLTQLAKLDEARYLYALGQLSKEMKTITRKPTTTPEKLLNSDVSSVSSSVDTEHERLLSDVDKGGDMKKLLAYRSKLRAEGKPLPKMR